MNTPMKTLSVARFNGLLAAALIGLLLVACVDKEATPDVVLNDNPSVADSGQVSANLGILQGKGAFAGTPSYSVSGEASAYVLNNNLTLYLSNFSSSNGPDLKVYLSTSRQANDIIDLGNLKSVRGNFNYPLPPGTDLSRYPFVLIWCKRFSALFGSAELKK